MKKDELKKKHDDFKQRIKENPNDGRLWMHYGFFLNGECYDPKSAIPVFKKAQKLLPERDFRLRLGMVYTDAGEVEKGISLIKEVLNDKPTTICYTALAGAYNKIDKFEEAIEACEKAIGIEPTFEEAYFLLGQALNEQDKLKEAIPYFRKAIELDSDYQAAFMELGAILVRFDDTLDEGIECLQKAINLDHEVGWTGWAMIKLATAFWKKKKEKEAEEAYKKAIEIFPNFPEIYNWYSEFLQGVGRVKDAEDALLEGIKKFPDDKVLYHCYSEFLKSVKRIPEAIEVLKQLMKKFPDYPNAYGRLADLLDDEERKVEAEDAYKDVIERFPDYPEGYDWYGDFLAHEDRIEEAENIYKEAMRRFPDHSEVNKWYEEFLDSLEEIDEADE